MFSDLDISLLDYLGNKNLTDNQCLWKLNQFNFDMEKIVSAWGRLRKVYGKKIPIHVATVNWYSDNDASKPRTLCECAFCLDIKLAIDQHLELNQRRRVQEVRRESSFVYVMKNNRNGYYKIGFSKRPHFREGTLQAEEPDVSILFSFPSDIQSEKMLHKKYKDCRVRGEWFALTNEHIEEIRQQAGVAR
jgi:hypothetical protein